MFLARSGIHDVSAVLRKTYLGRGGDKGVSLVWLFGSQRSVQTE